MNALSALLKPLLCLSFLFSQGQTQDVKLLESKSYEALKSIINDSTNTNGFLKLSISAYLNKARKAKDSSHMAFGYLRMVYAEKEINEKIKYADSAISLTKKWKDPIYPTNAFLARGIIYQGIGNYKKALDDYIFAHDYSQKNNSSFEVNQIILSNIGLLKRTLGEYGEAKTYFLQFYNAIPKNEKEKGSVQIFNSLYNLSNLYRNLKLIDSADYYNTLGYNISKTTHEEWHALFTLNKAANDYQKGSYKNAVDLVSEVLPYFIALKNENDVLTCYSYLGKSYFKLNDKKKGINYLKKSVAIFKKNKRILFETREDYLLLIRYYDSIKDSENQIKYRKLLVTFDSILNSDYRYLSKKIYTEYETDKLIRQKDAEIYAQQKEKKSSQLKNGIFLGLFVVALGLIFYLFNRQRIYQKRFKKFIADQKEGHKDKKALKEASKTAINVPKEIVEGIVKGLTRFEENYGYTHQNITLSSLAKKLNTNSKYLSMVINFNEHKSFRSYLNDLRIQYTIDRLQTDRMFRKYAVKSIAKEVGFNHSETFAKAFYKYSGVYPSFFIKQLNK